MESSIFDCSSDRCHFDAGEVVAVGPAVGAVDDGGVTGAPFPAARSNQSGDRRLVSSNAPVTTLSVTSPSGSHTPRRPDCRPGAASAAGCGVATGAGLVAIEGRLPSVVPAVPVACGADAVEPEVPVTEGWAGALAARSRLFSSFSRWRRGRTASRTPATGAADCCGPAPSSRLLSSVAETSNCGLFIPQADDRRRSDATRSKARKRTAAPGATEVPSAPIRTPMASRAKSHRRDRLSAPELRFHAPAPVRP